MKSEGAEELGSFKQASQGWLLLLVHALIGDWYSGFSSCHLAVGQIFVIMKYQLAKLLFLFMFLYVCSETS